MSIASRRLQRGSITSVGTIYLQPGTTSVANNANVTLNLRITPGTAVTVVEATINFDPLKLEYVGTDSSASPFDTNIGLTVGASSISIARATLDSGGIATDSLVAAVTFRALAGTGTSAVTLSNANAAFTGNYTNPKSVNALLTFTL